MNMRHFVIEGYCEENGKGDMPCKGTYAMGSHCIECDLFSSTSVENEILYVDEHGITDEVIGFGGEMEPIEPEKKAYYLDIWKKICKKKINEAYEDYMEMYFQQQIL